MKWTDPGFQPAPPKRGQGRRGAVLAMIADLQTLPGRWAEIATYPPTKVGSARSRGSMTVKRYPELEYAVEVGADGIATLYFRAKP